MSKRLLIISAAILLLAAATAFSQPNRSRTRFTSVYTDLGAGCKTLGGPDGGGESSVCKGVGGYEIGIYASAAALHINAELKGNNEPIILAIVDIGFNESKTRIEWRLANGKPFAVILRIPQYADPTDESPYFGKMVGEKLVIRGLKGYGNIALSVDTTTPNANAKAREMADAAYNDTGKP